MIDLLSSMSALNQGSPLDKLVSQYMSIERRPVDALKVRKDELNVRSAMFDDLKAKIEGLKDLAEELSSSSDSPFGDHSVSSSDADVATATASATASDGSYLIEDVVLAKSHRVRSNQMSSSWTTGSAGSFSVNGALVTVDAGKTLAEVRDAINGATYSDGRGVVATIVDRTLVLEGKSTGADYGLKVADLSGGVLSSVGLATTASSAIGISSATASSEDAAYTAARLTDGVLGDAGSWRGAENETSWTLTLDLGSSQTVSRIEWGRDQGGALGDRTPKDYTIEYWDGAEWQTLKTVTGGTLAAGATRTDSFHPVSTSQLRIAITATSDGLAPAVDEVAIYNDVGSFSLAALQSPGDASFSVNGIAVTRSGNTDLSDVVSGLTIGLKGAGGPVTLDVAGATAGMRSKIDSFLQKLNSLTDYLQAKSEVTDNGSGGYTRGRLSGSTLYTGLRYGLAADLGDVVTGMSTGAPSRLSELGIEMDANMHFVVADSTKLDDWLATDPGDIADFFGGSSGVAKRVFDRLEPYVAAPTTSSKSYLEMEQDGITSEQTSINDRVSVLNERLAFREQTLRAQFTRLQALMVQATQQQERIQAVFGYSSGWGL